MENLKLLLKTKPNMAVNSGAQEKKPSLVLEQGGNLEDSMVGRPYHEGALKPEEYLFMWPQWNICLFSFRHC